MLPLIYQGISEGCSFQFLAFELLVFTGRNINPSDLYVQITHNICNQGDVFLLLFKNSLFLGHSDIYTLWFNDQLICDERSHFFELGLACLNMFESNFIQFQPNNTSTGHAKLIQASQRW